MQGRSRMAAWMLVATLAGVSAVPSSGWAAGPAPLKQKVKLEIRLDGISGDSGAEITIKPGSPACRFKTMTYPVKFDRPGMVADLLPIEVETLSADRDCSFAIILKEPGHPDKTFRRSLQVQPTTDATAGKPQVLVCYLSSRTVATKVQGLGTAVTSKPATAPVRK